MSGTPEGGKRAAQTNKRKYGTSFYAIIGAKGGANGTTGGFYVNRELASTAGRTGGLKSRRTMNQQQRDEVSQRFTKIADTPKPHPTLLQRIFHRERTV